MIAGAGFDAPLSSSSAATPTMVRHLFPGLLRTRRPIAAEGSFQVLAGEFLVDDDCRRPRVAVLPGQRAPRDDVVAHGLEVLRPDELVAPQGRNDTVRPREVLNEHRVVAVVAVHRDRRRQAHGGDAGHLLDAVQDLLVCADRLLGIRDDGLGNGHAERQHLLGVREAGLDVPQRLERADHQAGADEEHHGQCDFRCHQRVARPVTFASVARAASAGLQGGRQVRPGELHRRQEAEQQAGEQRHANREEHDRSVDPDVLDPGKPFGRHRNEEADACVGERQPHDATRESQRHRLREQFAHDPAAAGAERRLHREFLLSPLGPDEEQVGDIRTGDQEDDSDRAEQHPEHAADVADDVGGERADIRAEPGFLEHLAGETRRHGEPLEHRGDHARHVRVRLLDRHLGLQACDALIAEMPDEDLRAVDAHRQDQLRILGEKAEAGGKHADDLRRRPVDGDLAADDAGVAAKFALPVRMGQHGARRRAR